jgi:hypothetical protein
MGRLRCFSSGRQTCNASLNDVFFDEVRKLGWGEGTTIVVERKVLQPRIFLASGCGARRLLASAHYGFDLQSLKTKALLDENR